MGSWYYLWENGDVSLVSASSKEAAVYMLDEVGEAHPERLKAIPDGFFIDLRPTKKPAGKDKFGWTLDDESESVGFVLSDVEAEARRRLNISEEVTAPLDLLQRLSEQWGGLGSRPLKNLDLVLEIKKQLRDEGSPQHVQSAVDLVGEYVEKKKTTLADLASTGTQLCELLDEVVDTQRSIIFREKKGLV